MGIEKIAKFNRILSPKQENEMEIIRSMQDAAIEEMLEGIEKQKLEVVANRLEQHPEMVQWMLGGRFPDIARAIEEDGSEAWYINDRTLGGRRIVTFMPQHIGQALNSSLAGDPFHMSIEIKYN